MLLSHQRLIPLISFFGLLIMVGIGQYLTSHPIYLPNTMPSKATIAANLLKMPLMFEENKGQTANEVKYLSRTKSYMMYFTPTTMVFDFRKSESTPPQGRLKNLDMAKGHASNSVIQMQFIGANQYPLVSGQEALPSKTNYFIGNDPKKWQTNVTNFARINYQNLYPGIDMVFYGKNNKLEYDIRVAPHVDPAQAHFQFTGAKKITLNKEGNLIVTAENEETLTMHKPIVYQMIGGQKHSVTGNFALTANNAVGFTIGKYDQNQPLIIDPTLSYSTFLGGSEDNCGLAIAIDATTDPSVFVTGFTKSTDFPIVGGVQSTNKGPGRSVFVTKINPEGTAFVYSTYIGGSGGNDEGFGIAIDGVDSAYITGETNSKDFPTVNPYQTTNKGARDFSAFVTKLNPEGNAIVYSTYLGGSGENQEGNGIAVDQQGFAYVTGETTSHDFPIKNAFQTTNKGPKFTAYVTKFNTLGNDIIFSTYLGGSGGQDEANAIAVDSNGFIYLTGETNSKDFPTFNAIQPTPGPHGAGQTGFVTAFNPNATSLFFSTYYGGSGGNDYPTALSLDSNRDITFGGYTNSLDFPVKNAFQTTNRGSGSGRGFNGFVAKLNHQGNTIVYSTYLGGSGGDDRVLSLKCNRLKVCIVVGQTNSTDFPTMLPVQATNNGPDITGFGTRINTSGTMVSSSYLGGSGGNDRIFATTNDDDLNTYSTGITNSADFPLRTPIQSSHPATLMAFVTKVAP